MPFSTYSTHKVLANGAPEITTWYLLARSVSPTLTKRSLRELTKERNNPVRFSWPSAIQNRVQRYGDQPYIPAVGLLSPPVNHTPIAIDVAYPVHHLGLPIPHVS